MPPSSRIDQANRRQRVATLLALVSFAVVLGGAAASAHEDNAQITVANDNGIYAYEPANLTIAVGGGVTWSNPSTLTNNAVDHPTQCIQGQSRGKCPFQSEDLPPGGSFEVHFPTSGTFHYFCAVHPYMEGVVTVGDGNPPAAPPATPSSSPTPRASSTPAEPSASPSAPGPGASPSSGPDAPTASAPATTSPGSSDDASEEPVVQPSSSDDETEPVLGAPTAPPGDDLSTSTVTPQESTGGIKAFASLLVVLAVALTARERRIGGTA